MHRLFWGVVTAYIKPFSEQPLVLNLLALPCRRSLVLRGENNIMHMTRKRLLLLSSPDRLPFP